MLRRGYDPRMSMGPILGTGGLAMLIPPSALAVILASLAGLSVADVLIASIIPGLLMAALFFVYVLIRCMMNPALAPRDEVADLSFGQRIGPFLIYVVPLLAIFVVVVGSILAGIASPTESAALGCVATVVAAACYRRLNWAMLILSCRETAKVSVLVLFIIAGSTTFSQILSFSGATDGLLAVIKESGLTPMTLILGMLLILLFLGCFMDQFSMMMITVPFFMPLVALTGTDPIWFAVMMLIMLEVGLLTPPFGMLLFVMKGVAPPEYPMRVIINAATPFILLEMLTIAIVLALPATALWLPGILR
jgi:tripartite ATP-independent transporter DctM subunit